MKIRAVLLCLASCALTACGSDAGRAHVVSSAVGSDIGINAGLEVRLDGAVDPLTVTSRSIRVTRPDGRPVECVREVSSGALVVWLVVDQSLLAEPPSEVDVTLLGAPSLHALGTQDGRRLGRTSVTRFGIRPELHVEGSGPPRLVAPRALAGVASEGPYPSPLKLVFVGPLDPERIRPEDCQAFPFAQGVLLEATQPAVHWRCVGQRFEVTLSWPRPHGPLQFDLRRCGLRGLRGDLPEPASRFRIAPAP